jgi:hypothetical protein
MPNTTTTTRLTVRFPLLGLELTVERAPAVVETSGVGSVSTLIARPLRKCAPLAAAKRAAGAR